MSADVLLTAAQALCDADTGAGGLRPASSPLVTGIYIRRAPTGATAPYIVLNERSDTEDRTKGADAALVRIACNIYTLKSAGGQGGTAIKRRLRTVLGRKQPAAVSGFSFGYLVRIGGMTLPEEEELFHFVEQFEGHVYVL